MSKKIRFLTLVFLVSTALGSPAQANLFGSFFGWLSGKLSNNCCCTRDKPKLNKEIENVSDEEAARRMRQSRSPTRPNNDGEFPWLRNK